jgi:PKD repeat protein
LQYGSPCVDSGTADGARADDLDGNPRPAGAGIDMGAYELQSSIVITSLSATPESGDPPLSVDFLCQATDLVSTITGYGWDFGDGESQLTTDNSTRHTFTRAGEFTVTCTVYNSAGEQVAKTVAVTVTNEPPVAEAGPDQIVPGNYVTLDGRGSSDADGTIVSWEWQLEHISDAANDKTASGANPTVTGLAFGHYQVTLTVTDNAGGTATDTMHLSVAASDLKYTQDEYDQAYIDGYADGQTCELEEDENGAKIIDGLLVIQDKGLLIIR